MVRVHDADLQGLRRDQSGGRNGGWGERLDRGHPGPDRPVRPGHRDDQWIPVDVARAERESPTGTTIAHGLLTLGFAPLFVRSVMELEGVTNTLNYGASRIRFLAPVPAGSRLCGRITIAAAEDMPRNGLRVTYRVTTEIENRERPVCVAELIAVHYR